MQRTHSRLRLSLSAWRLCIDLDVETVFAVKALLHADPEQRRIFAAGAVGDAETAERLRSGRGDAEENERNSYRRRWLGEQYQALETGRTQASWMGSTFSAPLKKKGYTLLLDLSRAPIPYVGSSLVVRKAAAHQEPKIYDALLKGTIDALRFFQKPENKPFVLKTMAKHLRLNRVEDAETGYHAMVAAYSSDFTPKPEGLQKIYSILSRTNPKLSTLKPETILDSTLIQRIQSSGY
jgi:hypothetical protein